MYMYIVILLFNLIVVCVCMDIQMYIYGIYIYIPVLIYIYIYICVGTKKQRRMEEEEQEQEDQGDGDGKQAKECYDHYLFDPNFNEFVESDDTSETLKQKQFEIQQPVVEHGEETKPGKQEAKYQLELLDSEDVLEHVLEELSQSSVSSRSLRKYNNIHVHVAV